MTKKTNFSPPFLGKHSTILCPTSQDDEPLSCGAFIFTTDIETILNSPPKNTTVFIEQCSDGTYPSTITRHTNTKHFFIISITTGSAFQITLAHFISDFLKQNIKISQLTAERIATVLHETLQNSIIHGNCEIQCSFSDLDTLETYYNLCEERIANPLYSQRRITIEIGYDSETLIIALADEGKGYHSNATEMQKRKKPNGMGLEIVSRYCSSHSFLPGGTTLLMSFSLVNPTASNNNNEEPQRDEIVKSLASSYILLVDDVEFNLIILNEILVSHGFTDIVTAKNGKDALEKTLERQPDLIVLDLVMPEMDGFTFCKEIRKNPELKNIPIVVQTAVTIPEQRTKAFEAGATDFISKPIDADEMIARILVHLERQKLFRDLTASRERMAEELDDARAMQKVLMPSDEQSKSIALPYQMSIYSHFQPSSELGGDFWGIQAISPHELAIHVTDFSGHGVTAALNTFRLHAVMQSQTDKAHDPGKYLTELNNSLVQLLTATQFATMFYAVINTKDNMMYYAAAASPPPIIIRQEDNAFEYVNSSGFPLGIQNKIPYDTQKIPFSRGDILCLYSDALIETEDEQHDFLDSARLQDFINYVFEHNPDADAEYLFNFLLNHFNKHHAKNINDDLTITLLQ